MPKNKVFLMSDTLSECSVGDCLLFWNRTVKLCLKLWLQSSYDYEDDFTLHPSQCDCSLSLNGITLATTFFFFNCQQCTYVPSLNLNPSIVQVQSKQMSLLNQFTFHPCDW